MRRIITEWTPENLPDFQDIITIFGADNSARGDFIRRCEGHQVRFLGSGAIDTVAGDFRWRADYSAVVTSWMDPSGFKKKSTLIQVKVLDEDSGPWGRMFRVLRDVTVEELPWMARFCITEAEVRENGHQGFGFGFETEEAA